MKFFWIGLALFLVLSFFAHLYPYFPFDPPVTLLIQSFHPGWWTQVLVNISLVGSPLLSIPLIMGVGVVVVFWRNHQDALFIVASSAGSFLMGEMVKRVVLRPRPNFGVISHLVAFPDKYSYPSGHVLIFVGFFGFVLYLLCIEKRNLWVKIAGITLCLVAMTLIGISRIYLGVHWLSDVAGGYLLGGIWVYIMSWFYRRYKR